MSACTVSTSDPLAAPVSPLTTGGGLTDLASALGKEIERLANHMFQGGLPSHVGPNAANVGAGGASPAVMLPPVPGFVQTPPLASAPAPKESDLRAIPTLLSEQLALPSPIAVATAQGADAPRPYFLDLAGIPSAPPAPPAMTGAPTGISSSATPPLPAVSPTPVAASAPAASAPEPGGIPSSSSPSFSSYAFQPELVPELPKTGGIFDAASIKRDFPILEERVHGRPVVWLDNAATTQKPHAVIDRVSYFYEHENSNVHRAAHTLAARATDAYEAARDKVRRFLNAPSSRQIIFVRGATEGINLVAQSWGRRNVGPGDEIVITWLEHHANIVPWQQLCSEKGARLRVAPVDSRGDVILEEYEKLLGPRTRLVSFTQVSNALGTIVPAQEMVAMARRHGARVLVDGAQAVSHMPVDVQALDCDFYSFSGHKIFAPTGIGVVYGKSDVLEAMPPWQGGGNMIADVTFEKTTYQPPPGRFEAGTGNIADAVGLGAALDYVTALGLENIRRYEHELLAYAEERLAGVPGLRLIGTPREKAGVISFVLDGVRTEDVGGILDQEGIAVRSGHHCAQPILRRFGLESTVRASLAPYNTCEDIDALVAALHRLQAGRPATGPTPPAA
jgi:cysteine desulfurase/selenocysteine lyase